MEVERVIACVYAIMTNKDDGAKFNLLFMSQQLIINQ